MREIFTGTMRPRHQRFSDALKKLRPSLDVTLPSKASRGVMKLTHMAGGIRQMSIPHNPEPVILHQALGSDDQPFYAEFDVPLGVHNYHVPSYLAHGKEAAKLMESNACRGIFTFSAWAKRAFHLHFGEKVAEKCHVMYPLASKHAHTKPAKERGYHFTFIATQFQIKCGPELVAAYKEVAQEFPETKLCIVTRLAEVEGYIKDTKDLPNLEWREADLNEQQIADLLADTRTLVHPSLVDSFGVVVLEALAAGCALITTDIASFPEMCWEGENGALITPPFAGVVGDAFITEYGTTSYVNRLLENMDLGRMREAIRLSMGYFMAHPEKVEGCMKASEHLYHTHFAQDVWLKKMEDIL